MSKWDNPLRMVENHQAKILWSFQIQTEKQVMANQPNRVVVGRQRKSIVIEVAIPIDGNIRKKELEKF